MFKKLRNKFLLINMSIISVVMISAFAIIYIIIYNYMQMENQNKLLSLPVNKTNNQFNPDDKQSVIVSSNAIRKIPTDYTLSFGIEVNAKGEILNINSIIDIPDYVYREAAKLAWNKKDSSTLVFNGREWKYIIFPLNNFHITSKYGKQIPVNTKDSKYQIAFLDVTNTYETLNELLTTFLFVGLGMLVVIFIISLYFANRAIKPIAESWEKQKQFVTDASHELKTPLAIINANTDALLANQEKEVKIQKKWLGYIRAETDRMAKLVNDLLYLAKTENGNIPTFHSSFNISQMVYNVILSMEAIVFEKSIKLSYSVEPNLMVKGNPEQIKQLVIILFDNAIKYTMETGIIDIHLKKTNRQIIFTIQNSGEGIKKQDLTRVFDRFYRIDPSRNRESGYGLGLSVAKAIIDQHSGKLFAESVENENTMFTFSLRS